MPLFLISSSQSGIHGITHMLHMVYFPHLHHHYHHLNKHACTCLHCYAHAITHTMSSSNSTYKQATAQLCIFTVIFNTGATAHTTWGELSAERGSLQETSRSLVDTYVTLDRYTHPHLAVTLRLCCRLMDYVRSRYSQLHSAHCSWSRQYSIGRVESHVVSEDLLRVSLHCSNTVLVLVMWLIAMCMHCAIWKRDHEATASLWIWEFGWTVLTKYVCIWIVLLSVYRIWGTNAGVRQTEEGWLYCSMLGRIVVVITVCVVVYYHTGYSKEQERKGTVCVKWRRPVYAVVLFLLLYFIQRNHG